jgi:hypothetical protein
MADLRLKPSEEAIGAGPATGSRLPVGRPGRGPAVPATPRRSVSLILPGVA